MKKKKYQKYFNATITATVAASGAVVVVPNTTDASTSFSDVPSTYNFYDEVMNLSERGIIKGFEDGTFRPGENVTRGQAAKIIAGVLGLDTKNVKNPSFKDIPTSHQYYGAIAALANAGIVSGYEDDTYRPGQPVQRNHMAKIIAGAFELKPSIDGSIPFKDVREDYKNYISALYENAVTTGKTATTFDGASNVTRGQLAAFVIRAENVKSSEQLSLTVESVSDNSIQTSEGELKIASSLKSIFHAKNAAALEGAEITAVVSEGVVTGLSSITFNTSGTSEKPLVFDGGKATIQGNVIVNADQVAINNITVTGNLTVTDKVVNEFSAESVVINGELIVEEASADPVASINGFVATETNQGPKIDLNNSKVNSVNVKRDGASITSNTKLSGIKVSAKVSVIEVNADVEKVTINVTVNTEIKGTGSIDQVAVEQAVELALNIAGQVKDLVVGNKDVKVEVGASIVIDNLVIPVDSDVASIVKNYNAVKDKIKAVKDDKGSEVKPDNNSGGSSNSGNDNNDRDENEDLSGQFTLTVESVSNNSIQTSEGELKIVSSLKPIFNSNNAAALEGAEVKVVVTRGFVTGISSITFNTAGTSEKPLVFDGGDATIRENVIVNADFVDLNNMTVTGNVLLTDKVVNEFSTNGLKITGELVIEQASPERVASLNGFVVAETNQGPKIDLKTSEINSVHTKRNNVSLTSDTKLPEVKVSAKVTAIEVNADVEKVTINVTVNIEIKGTGTIDQVAVEQATEIALQVAGEIGELVVTNKNTKVEIGVSISVNNLLVPAGSDVASVVRDYNSVKDKIKEVKEYDAENFTLSIMHTNDTHANLDNIAKTVTAVKEVRTEKPDALLLNAGDVLSGTLYFNEFQGQADLQFMNLMKYDAMTFGNHEFDLGSSDEGHQALADFIVGAHFPFVSANVNFAADEKFQGLFSDGISSEPENGKIYNGIVKEINGQKVGIFGLTTAETKGLSSPGAITFEDYKAEAEKAVKAFEELGINKIIAITHIGYDDNEAIDNDLKLAAEVEGIDVIVGGHSHTELKEPKVVAGDATPTVIVQAGANNSNLGVLDVEFDSRGVVNKQAGELIAIGSKQEDAQAAALLKPYKDQVNILAQQEIGVSTEVALENPRTNGDNTKPSVRKNETILGNLITDGMLAKAEQASGKDVIMAFQNGGGIRSSIGAGPITVGEVITVLPFGNTLAVMDVTGAELKEAFEISVGKYPGENGGFLHVAGGKVKFDSSKPAGERVVSLQYKDADGNYVDVQDTETYTVATNAFTAQGGDDYTVFAKAYAEGRVKDLGLSDWQNFAEHLKSLDKIPTKVEERIVNLAEKSTEVTPQDISSLLVAPELKIGEITEGFITGITIEEGEELETTTTSDVVTVDGLQVTAVKEGSAVVAVRVIKEDKVIKQGTVVVKVAGSESSDNSDFSLSIMHTNDTHANLNNIAKTVTAVKEVRAQKPDALLLNAGDVFSGTLYFNKFQGQADLQFMNLMKYDAMTFGNHEFDLGSSNEGHQALADFIVGAHFPFVSANVNFAADEKFQGLFSDLLSSQPENGKIYNGIVKEINGEKIGIFGLTTAETEALSSPEKITFEDYKAEAEKAVKAFEQLEINKIIAITHIGYDDNAAIDNDLKLAAEVEGIDVIVGGHSHTELKEPKVVAEDATPTVIVQTGGNNSNLGVLDVKFNSNGVVMDQAGELIAISGKEEDGEAKALLAPYKAQVDELAQQEIGVSTEITLENPRTNGDNTKPSIRKNETILGNLITDGMLTKAEQASGKDVIMALQNGGGIRAAIEAGPITVGEVITVLPFGNTLAVMDVTGAELKEAFEISVGKYPGENGGFLHVAGGKVRFDSSKPAGERIVSLQYKNAEGNYVDVQDTETYTVATNAFTAQGGDGYTPFAKAYAEGRVIDLGLSDWENFAEHLKGVDKIPTEVEGRIVNVAEADPNSGSDIVKNPGTTPDTVEVTQPPLYNSNDNELVVSQIARYDSGQGATGTEILAYDANRKLAFVTNGATTVKGFDILSFANLESGKFTAVNSSKRISLADYNIKELGNPDITSIASHLTKDLIAITAVSENKTDNGYIVFATKDGEYVNHVEVGALPDMVTFTPDGKKAIVANEGEPADDYLVDPEGSISIIDLENSYDVTTLTFDESMLDSDVRWNSYVSSADSALVQLEPEYVTVSDDSTTAYVSLQENNAIATVDLENGVIIDVRGLGVKDHSIEGNEIDAHNKDDISIQKLPLLSYYMPDAIDTFTVGGKTYIITPNEGDSRDWEAYSEEIEVPDIQEKIKLNAEHYEGYTQEELEKFVVDGELAHLEKIKLTKENGLNENGEYEALYAFGGRSFSIFEAESMDLVFDSGSEFEEIIAKETPDLFNIDNEEVSKDNRSDNKGPEPESAVVGVIDGTPYAFVGLERYSGIMVYDVTDVTKPDFVTLISSRDFSADIKGDVSPEGLVFVPAEESPTGQALLVATHEVSGTVAVYELGKGVPAQEVSPEEFSGTQATPKIYEGNVKVTVENATQLQNALIKGDLILEGTPSETFEILNVKVEGNADLSGLEGNHYTFDGLEVTGETTL